MTFSLTLLSGWPCGGQGGPGERCAQEGLSRRAGPYLGAGVAECVRENTLRTSAPQVLGHLAQGPKLGTPPVAEVSCGPWGNLACGHSELVPVPLE